MGSRHFGARLAKYVNDVGYRCMVLENELLRIEILVDKGATIRSLLHKPTDTEFMWHAPRALRPASVTLGGSFFEGYEGGWQEVLPNGGPPSVHPSGAPLPFHGESVDVPWEVEVQVDEPDEVKVRLSLETARTPLLVQKTLTLRSGSQVLEIEETLTNLSRHPLPIMWGHHPAVGAPFLGPECRIDVPARRASTHRAEPIPDHRVSFDTEFEWPYAPGVDGSVIDMRMIPGPDSGTADWACLLELESGWYAITNTQSRIGFGLVFDSTLFPYLWYWQMWGGWKGYPFYGRAYCCALEPWTSWPDAGLDAAIANGSALVLDGNQAIGTTLKAVVYTGLTHVESISEAAEVTGG
jgi:galactose mutarotase-like enzyme